MKRVAWFTAVILATVVVIYLLWEFHEAVVLFLLSLAVAAAVRAPVDHLAGRRLPRGISLGIVYLGVILTIAAIITFAGSLLLRDLGQLSDQFVKFYDHLWNTWPQGTDIQKQIVNLLPAPNDLYRTITGPQGGVLVQTVMGFTLSSLTILSQFVAVLVLSLYWSIDQVHFERLWLSVLPVDQRAQAREIWRAIETGFGSYIRSEVLQSVLAGILLGIGFTMIHLPFPVLLAIFGALAWLVPWLGALLAVIPIVLVGTVSSFGLGITAGVYTIVVLAFLELVVERRIYSRRQYSPLLTVLYMLALADVLGIIGLLIAPPLAAATQIFATHLLRKANRPVIQVETSHLTELEERLESVRVMANNDSEEVPPQTQSIIDRLDKLLKEANNVLTD